jgi:peptidylprolyl isomerase
MKDKARIGDTVKVHYTGRLEDGTIFDSSIEREPLEFTIGREQIIPGFEDAVVGMKPGESKVAKVKSKDAYGPHRNEMVMAMELSKLPDDLDVHPGQQLQLNQHDGDSIPVRVIEVTNTKVTLDANHPLAGKDLTFDIMLEAIA